MIKIKNADGIYIKDGIIGYYEETVGSCDYDEHENDNYYLGDYEKEKL